MSFLRNPLAWHKRYVDNVHDMPSTPAGVIGRAAHVALQHFYGGLGKEAAIALGLEHLRNVADFEINFGVHKTRRAQKARRVEMEKELLQALSFYLARPPKYKVLGIEIASVAEVPGVPLPVKAISDLVVVSKVNPHGVDIVDHKFIDSFSAHGVDNPLFIMQALFNYYTVLSEFKRPVYRFILQECKKRKNKDGSNQMRRTVLEYASLGEEFKLFKRLLNDASHEIARDRLYLPNPSDMFEGKNSFDIYRLGLLEGSVDN
ncbi:MAG: hypothetical protein RLZZ283_425 [Candidatus Parcubacteria bacterium]|jgi:hypothetical protein